MKGNEWKNLFFSPAAERGSIGARAL